MCSAKTGLCQFDVQHYILQSFYVFSCNFMLFMLVCRSFVPQSYNKETLPFFNKLHFNHKPQWSTAAFLWKRKQMEPWVFFHLMTWEDKHNECPGNMRLAWTKLCDVSSLESNWTERKSRRHVDAAMKLQQLCFCCSWHWWSLVYLNLFSRFGDRNTNKTKHFLILLATKKIYQNKMVLEELSWAGYC